MGIRTITFGSTNGVKLGSTGNKIGFLGATPIVRPSGTTDLRQALINLGLYSSGGATPLNLNGGAFSAGSATIAGNLSIGGSLTLGSNLNITGTLGVTGNETVTGTLDVDGVTTLSTVNVTDTLGVTGAFTGTTATFSGPVTLKDPSDNTKSAKFDLSNISASTQRTVNIPDINSTTVRPVTPTTHFFATGISSQGVVSTAQPTFSDLASHPTTLLGYGITDAQGLDDDLTAIAALSTASFGRGLLTQSSRSAADQYLGLTIGQDVQQWSSKLDEWGTKEPYDGTITVPTGYTVTFSTGITLSAACNGFTCASLNIGNGGRLGANAFLDTPFVPTTTKVNNHPLVGDIAVTADDLALTIGRYTQAYSLNLDGWSGKTPYSGTIVIPSSKTLTSSNTITLSANNDSNLGLNIGNGGTLGARAFDSTVYVPATFQINSHPMSGTSINLTGSDFGLTINGTVQAHSATLDTLATVSAPTAGSTLVETTKAQTLTNKTFSGGTISGATQNTLTSAAGSGLTITATQPATTPSSQAGTSVGITASNARAGTSVAGAAQGGSVTITAGDAARLTSGNAKGGNVIVNLGSGVGTGTGSLPGKLIVNSNSATPPENISGYTVAGEIWNMHSALPNNVPGGFGIDTFGNFGVFDFRRANGTAVSLSHLNAGDIVGVIGGLGYGSTGYSGGQAQIRWTAGEDWTDSAQGEYLDFLATPNGAAGAFGVRNVMRMTGDQLVVRPPLDVGGPFNGISMFYSGGLNVGDVLTDPGNGIITSTKGVKPPHLADGSATNDTIYYSNTQGKLVYKDSGGTVHPLY